MGFYMFHKPSWRQRLRLAWKVLRGVDLQREFMQQQMRQFSGEERKR